jgi:hypothetical protein
MRLASKASAMTVSLRWGSVKDHSSTNPVEPVLSIEREVIHGGTHARCRRNPVSGTLEFDPAPPRRVTWQAWLLAATAIIPVALAGMAAARAPRVHVLLDYWHVLTKITEDDGSQIPGELLTYHLDQPFVVPSLLFWADAAWFGGDNRVLTILSGWASISGTTADCVLVTDSTNTIVGGGITGLNHPSAAATGWQAVAPPGTTDLHIIVLAHGQTYHCSRQRNRRSGRHPPTPGLQSVPRTG